MLRLLFTCTTVGLCCVTSAVKAQTKTLTSTKPAGLPAPIVLTIGPAADLAAALRYALLPPER